MEYFNQFLAWLSLKTHINDKNNKFQLSGDRMRMSGRDRGRSGDTFKLNEVFRYPKTNWDELAKTLSWEKI